MSHQFYMTSFFFAQTVGIEPTTFGFGDQRSAN